jgi:hypothetical protein
VERAVEIKGSVVVRGVGSAEEGDVVVDNKENRGNQASNSVMIKYFSITLSCAFSCIVQVWKKYGVYGGL